MLIFLNIFLLIDLVSGNIILQSPTITNWGDWGPVEKCPNNTYAVGLQLKVEEKQRTGFDDTALNGIRFFCSKMNGEKLEPTTTGMIQSSVGPWGNWRSEFYCNGVIVGFQLNSESHRRNGGDDTGANNLRVLCSDGTILEGEGHEWGTWTSVQKCRLRSAVCSLQTQVEVPQGYGTLAGDDTSLNNLKVECCDIPNPAQNCTPSDNWELVAECDNTNAFTPTTCSYERKIGLGYSTTDTMSNSDGGNGYNNKNNHERSILEDVGFSLGIEAQVLSHKFQFETGTSEKTGYPWGSTKSDTWNHETITKVSFDVPPGVRTSVVQVVGTCGLYLVRTSKFQRVDFIGSPDSMNNNMDTIMDDDMNNIITMDEEDMNNIVTPTVV